MKMDVRETGQSSMDWSDLAQDRDQWWGSLVNMVENLQVLE
jgi:hypothetical protein